MVKKHPGGQQDSSATQPTGKEPPVRPSRAYTELLATSPITFTNQPLLTISAAKDPNNSDHAYVGSRT